MYQVFKKRMSKIVQLIIIVAIIFGSATLFTFIYNAWGLMAIEMGMIYVFSVAINSLIFWYLHIKTPSKNEQ